MTALSSDIPTRQITAVPPTAAPAAATPRQPKTVFVTAALVRRSCMSLPRMPEVFVPASRPALAPSRPALFSSRFCLRLIQRPSRDLSDIPARRMVSARFLLCSSWSSTLSCLARAFFDFASQRAMRLRARPAGSLSATAFPSRYRLRGSAWVIAALATVSAARAPSSAIWALPSERPMAALISSAARGLCRTPFAAPLAAPFAAPSAAPFAAPRALPTDSLTRSLNTDLAASPRVSSGRADSL